MLKNLKLKSSSSSSCPRSPDKSGLKAGVFGIIFFITSACFALQANLNGDNIVDFKDFAIFARDWMKPSNLTDPNTDLDKVIYYIVSGSVTPDATGNYFFAGVYNGKSYFKHEFQIMYLFSHVVPGNYWAIGPTLSVSTFWEHDGQGILGIYEPDEEEGLVSQLFQQEPLSVTKTLPFWQNNGLNLKIREP